MWEWPGDEAKTILCSAYVISTDMKILIKTTTWETYLTNHYLCRFVDNTRNIFETVQTHLEISTVQPLTL